MSDVVVCAILQAVIEDRMTICAPAPYSAEVVARFIHSVDGACEGAVVEVDPRSQTMAE